MYDIKQDLKDKVVFVTGGARGIGFSIASAFASCGCKVAICDLDAQSVKESAKKIADGYKVETLALVGNVVNSQDVDSMVDQLVDKWGRVDILVNNAGITRDTLLMRMKEEDWDAVLSVNLKGVFLVTRAVAKIMIKQRSGKIINIASVVGIMGNVGQANYSASKGGVIAFTKTVAKELASRGINVNAIAPGFIKTKMTEALSDKVKEKIIESVPSKRWGTPEDVAGVCLFLGSSLSSYVTGQTIVVDGGML